MYMYISYIVLTIGIVLFIYNYGWFIIQLGWKKRWFLTPTHVIAKIFNEISTQTDLSHAETLSQDAGKDKYSCGGDEIDAPNKKKELAHEVGLQCPNVKKSLQQVFECAYSQLILTWYSVPEPRDNQPLYNALGREFNMIVDRVIGRASDINISAIAVDYVRILTQHLRNVKQPNRGQLFNSRADEFAVLRVFSEALVRNLFPESLTAQDLTRSALNEIVTLNVLELLVNWLSDPDSLNQLLVSSLDIMTLKGGEDELQGPKREDTPSSLDSEGKGVIAEGTGDLLTDDVKPKKKGAKLKEKFSRFIDKMKRKETKKKQKAVKKEERATRRPEDELLLRSFVACSALYLQESDSDDSDLESCPPAIQEEMMEFKLSYEMWRLSSWVVSVKQVQEEDGELNFTIRLEEASNPEKLHWDVRKSQKDIRLFHSSLQDCPNLPSIAELLESTEYTMNDEFKEQARVTLETFLKLVKDSQLGHSPEVFQFLCPLEQLLTEEEANGGVWSLLSNLAYLLTPAIEEEEDVCALGPAKSDDPGTEGAGPEGLVETEDEEADLKGSCDALCRLLPVVSGDSSKSLEKAPDFLAASQPITDLSEDVALTSRMQNDSTDDRCSRLKRGAGKREKAFIELSAGPQNRREKGQLIVGRVDEHRAPEPNKRGVNQSGKEQQEATKAIIDLLKEITGNSMMWNIFDVILKPVMPLLKKKVNSFLNQMNPTEPQMASYIDLLREKQWPGGVPVVSEPARTKEQKSQTKERANQLINTKCSSFFLKKNDVQAVFKAFQDTEENKKLVYMLLSFLLRELMPGESALNVKAIAFLNSPVLSQSDKK
ncbi:uncharacterized protein si:rp71-46j2.7 isoform X2 [Anguilla rostrata]|uniref:uncharacterized protein si:rp71-46j2.7 isoform X2 n=1 Tax=Anguilla rostrata TaxID=7938 RepID=UPI0030D517CD